MSETVTIARLGHRGDGIAETDAGPLFVPLTLPGEVVRVARRGRRAELVEVLEPAADRIAPPCPHFGVCGGCALQMLPLEATRRVKRGFVKDALSRAGVKADIAPAIGAPLAARRRAIFSAELKGGELAFGFYRRGERRIADIDGCLVLRPAIAEALPLLRGIARRLARPKRALRVTVLETAAGLDIAVGGGPEPSPALASRLVELCAGEPVARLSLGEETLFQIEGPRLLIAGIALEPPPGAFVQASAEAAEAMAGLVSTHLAGAKRAADLFCGLGTFALPLAREMPVTAVEAHEPALAALLAASRGAEGLKPVEGLARDLLRFPLAPQELKRFDAAVLDPPWDGARAQAEMLAASPLKRLAMVSCNPASLARDLSILIGGGYQVERVVPVDQFVYSAETEVVALLRRN
ncbi:class I SAM-dependent RNA methyltransferase [Afifella pfennigii]|uniref:class I SAM-dependent RNA methyltransferase n=1 Tax=Afifella pfennigii TaxID=209897 RepID=UPI00047BE4B7|nr:methyltransferase [Afifella pfennigii]